MSSKKAIVNAIIVNEGKKFKGFVFIDGNFIVKVKEGKPDKDSVFVKESNIIDAGGKLLIPGVIDDQVHFRDPGLEYKADLYTESRAAVAGGVTSFMEMPNTIPNTLTQDLLEEKYKHASSKSLANYSFYMGTSNENINEVLATNTKNVCGVKIFLGASTGNMLVDDLNTLETIFSKSKALIAVHCEDEGIIQHNIINARNEYGENIPFNMHPEIRSEEACFKSSSFAVNLAKKYHTRLHVLHLSTGKELELFNNEIPLEKKKITTEVCVHHLWFSDQDYILKGSLIKWNPAIKTKNDREQLREAVNNDLLDVVATDHAPHTLEEKTNNYLSAPSGGPLVQHSLNAMLELSMAGVFSFEKVVEKMCHNPALLFNIEKRGFIREGYYADLVLIDTLNQWIVEKENILYKCGWSPFENQIFNSKVTHTFVNGNLIYNNGHFNENEKGKRLFFDR